MKVGVILSGCGVYDGSEIHESVLTLLALAQAGCETECIAPEIKQHHVINHMNGEEMQESRDVIVESARIARGNIRPASAVQAADYDILVLPGGFGAAKNLSGWAIAGPDCEINGDVQRLIREAIDKSIPLAAMCMAPVVIARALSGTEVQARLTVGTTAAESPYDIQAISDGMAKLGSEAVMCEVNSVVVDKKNKIVTTPCYMMNASVADVWVGIEQAIKEVIALAK